MNHLSIRLQPVALFIAVCVCVLVLFQPADACAGWPFGEVKSFGLLFGERYTSAAGAQNNHGGVDILAEPGSVIISPVTGHVSFVGRVPAGEGATQLAVSVQIEDGRIMTFMPFEVTSVGKGQSLSAGTPIGTLAASGDQSSSLPHLHIGLRSGSLYLDPVALLVVPPSPGKPSEIPAPVSVPSPVPSSDGAQVVAGSMAASTGAVSGHATQGSFAGAGVAELAPDTHAVPAISVRSGQAATSQLLRIPEIQPVPDASISLSAVEYGGDRQFLEGMKKLAGAVPVRRAAVTGSLSITAGLIGAACLVSAVRGRAARRLGELSIDRPAEEQVAAASGQW